MCFLWKYTILQHLGFFNTERLNILHCIICANIFRVEIEFKLYFFFYRIAAIVTTFCILIKGLLNGILSFFLPTTTNLPNSPYPKRSWLMIFLSIFFSIVLFPFALGLSFSMLDFCSLDAYFNFSGQRARASKWWMCLPKRVFFIFQDMQPGYQCYEVLERSLVAEGLSNKRGKLVDMVPAFSLVWIGWAPDGLYYCLRRLTPHTEVQEFIIKSNNQKGSAKWWIFWLYYLLRWTRSKEWL